MLHIPGKKGVYNGAQMIGQNNLLAQADHNPGQASADVTDGGVPPGKLRFDGAVAHNGPCHQLGEHAYIQQKLGVAPLGMNLLPIAVHRVGNRLEGVKADADGQPDAGNGQMQRKKCIDVFYGKGAVLEYEQHSQIQQQGNNQRCFGAGPSPVLFNQQPAEIIGSGAEQQKQYPQGLSPCIKYQRKYNQYNVFVFNFGCQPVNQQAQW